MTNGECEDRGSIKWKKLYYNRSLALTGSVAHGIYVLRQTDEQTNMNL